MMWSPALPNAVSSSKNGFRQSNCEKTTLNNARLNQHLKVSAGYLFADAAVVRFPANQTLEGLMIPQVPAHQFTFQAAYARPTVVTLSFQGRVSSSQFDDDQNLFPAG